MNILVETAERSDVIDKERAQKAKERAESRIAKSAREEAVDYERARVALMKALIRIRVVDKS